MYDGQPDSHYRAILSLIGARVAKSFRILYNKAYDRKADHGCSRQGDACYSSPFCMADVNSHNINNNIKFADSQILLWATT